MSRKIRICWPDGDEVSIDLLDNPVADLYARSVKHLQHVDLIFGPRQNPWHFQRLSTHDLCQQISQSPLATELSIDQSLLLNQSYLNFLHEKYADNYPKDPSHSDWLDLHDLIHALEDKIAVRPGHQDIWFDYAHKAGPLNVRFDRSWLDFSVTRLEPGMCILTPRELGKSPIVYYQDGEPLDSQRICKLVKPWIWLKPVMSVSVDYYDNFAKSQIQDLCKFQEWFEPVRKTWCDAYDLQNWSPREMFCVIPIGWIDNLKLFVDKFSDLNYPTRLRL